MFDGSMLPFKFYKSQKNSYNIKQKTMIQDMVKAQYFEQYQAIQVYNPKIIQSESNISSVVKSKLYATSPKTKRQQRQQEQTAKLSRLHYSRVFQQLIDKYFISISNEEFENQLQKIMRFKHGLGFKICDTEVVPVVFYYNYVDLIGIYTTKEFSVRNGLNAKSFNRKYKAFIAFQKQQRQPTSQSSQSQSQACKFSDRQQEDNVKEENDQKNQSAYTNFNYKNKLLKIGPNITAWEAIDLVYDFIFKSEYFQEHRRQIILKLAEKFEKTNPKLIEEITWTDLRILKIYYVIFYYCRQNGAHFDFQCLKNGVCNKLNLKMTKGGYHSIIRLFKKYKKTQESIQSQE